MAKKRILRRKRQDSDSTESYKSEDSDKLEADAQLGADFSDDGDISDSEDDLKRKVFQIKKSLPWTGTLDVVFNEELCIDDEQNDLEREAVIYKQAFDAVHKSMPKLEESGITVFRPDDYFAEMSKSDTHMQRVRERILEIQKDKERSENAKRLREEKKFAQKAQASALQQKQDNKRKLAEAVKKHRKGMKAQLETMLSNASNLQDEEEHERKGKKLSRVQRNKKFGYGGQKKRAKKNTLDSLNEARKPRKGGIKKRR
uniref:rRNA-processing protein EBP2 homolog n=1 Tax=Bursaphelenchus xylophilus TaxID=6326 RepID=A0A1I7SVQ1_BURXY